MNKPESIEIQNDAGNPTWWRRIGSVVRGVRHPVRAAAMALAALSVTFGIARGGAMVAAMIGAALGVFIGQIAASTKVRLWVLLLVTLVLCVVGWQACVIATKTMAFPRMVGPGRALALTAVARFFIGGFAFSALPRMLAARIKAFLGVELGITAAAMAAAFASHRDGIIARPLWLSDWAWQNGYDPVNVFLAIGAVAVVILAGLLITESKRPVSVMSFVCLPLLALLAIAMLELRGIPEPEAGNDLGLTGSEVGDPPIPNDKDGMNPTGGGQGDEQEEGEEGGGGQGEQEEGEEGGGGQGQEQEEGGQGQGQQQEGEEGGQGQGQQQQQQQGQGQGQQQQPPDIDSQDTPSSGPPAPMAVVLLGDDYYPPSQGFYFRQDIWSHFNGSRLVSSKRGDVDLDMVKSFPTVEVEVREPPVTDETIRQEVHAEVALLTEHARPFALESVVSMKPETNPNPKRFVRSYSFVSRSIVADYGSLFGKDPGDSDWTDDQLAYYLQVPGDTRYGELAQEILEDLPEDKRGDPFAEAVKIKLWMDENLVYSTAERHAGKKDPTADFLFGNKIGYCVHFAHAAVYMWRSLGIPARVATGYYVTEESRRGSAIIIRGSDAHAWPELYLDGVGWVVLDIAAQQNLDPMGEPVDEDLTKLLADMAREEPDPDEQGERSKGKREERHFGRDLALGFLALFGAAAVVLYGIKIWRRLAPTFAGPKALPRAGYRRTLDKLAEAGLWREYGETREAFSRRVADKVPSLGKLTDLNVAARFGNPELPLEARPEFSAPAWKDGMKAVDKELPKAAPLWRRILGALNPLTFTRAR